MLRRATPDSDAKTTTLRVEIAPRTIGLILGAIAGIWLFGQLTAVITVVIVAMVLVGTIDPLVAQLERRGFGRGRALVLVFVVASLALVGVVLLAVPPLLSQALDLITDAPAQRGRLVVKLQEYGWAKPLISAVEDIPLADIGARAARVIVGYSTHFLAVIGYSISTLFLAIYLLADPVRSKGLVYAVVPRHHHVKLAKILIELKVIVGGYMRGQLITSLAISVFVFILLTITGSENALALAIFAGVTDVIPFVGGYIASTPVIVAVLPNGPTVTTIVVIIMVIYQEFESRILVPKVYGRVLRLPPAIVLIALLVGGTLGGILGALLALPIAAGLQMVVRELHVDLPGEQSTASARGIRLDEQATLAYQQLSEGVSTADAGAIADDLASMVKRTEEGGPTLIQQLPPHQPDDR